MRYSNSILNPLFCISVLLIVAQPLHAQLLVMNFDVDATTTVVGPSPSSISGSAGSVAGGSTANGLSARINGSVPKADINMTFPNTAGYWDVNGIDVSIDFQREESVGSFFTRTGNNFDFGMNSGNLRVIYEVDNGVGGTTTVNSGNIQGIPNDNTWRNYRFTYNPVTGIGIVVVDGALVWSNDGPDNRNLYWTGAGNMIIGNAMDASGNQSAIFDDVSYGMYTTSPVLPVELIEFTANRTEKNVMLNWITATEMNNDYFEIQRSSNNEEWETVFTLRGAGNSNNEVDYIEYDYNAPESQLFYRLNQVDFDGKSELSEVVFVPKSENTDGKSEVIFQTFPNPIEKGNRLNLVLENPDGKDLLLVLRDVNGKEIYVKPVFINADKQYEVMEISQTIPAGQYIITATSDNSVYNSKLMVR